MIFDPPLRVHCVILELRLGKKHGLAAFRLFEGVDSPVSSPVGSTSSSADGGRFLACDNGAANGIASTGISTVKLYQREDFSLFLFKSIDRFFFFFFRFPVRLMESKPRLSSKIFYETLFYIQIKERKAGTKK